MSRISIATRMDAALAGGPLEYRALAELVFPRDQYPRAWRYKTGGGPPGCYVALTAAIRRHGFVATYDVDLRRIIHRRGF